jgi:hypothetical protein
MAKDAERGTQLRGFAAFVFPYAKVTATPSPEDRIIEVYMHAEPLAARGSPTCSSPVPKALRTSTPMQEGSSSYSSRG